MERDAPVSVVIATYNRAKLLGRAIGSVLAQTLPPSEVIVVDDGSQDGTAEAVEGVRDSRIRLVRLGRRQGAAHARNVGIEKAGGEWIAFLDSDDVWLPRKLELQMARLHEVGDPRTAVVACLMYRQDADGRRQVGPVKELAEGDALSGLLGGLKWPSTSANMVRRSALLEAGGFDESLPSSQDLDLWLRLADASHRFAAVREPLVVVDEYGHDRISTDPLAKLQGFRKMDERWGALMRERAGGKAYRRWRRKARRRLADLHAGHVGRLVSSGSRSDAWRYVARMVPYIPWGTRYVAKTFAFATTGRRGGG